MKNIFLSILTVTTIVACSSLEHIGTPNQYIEPTDGDVAYIRFLHQPDFKGVYPETDCMSGSVFKAGIFAPFSGNKVVNHYAVVNVKERMTPLRWKTPKKVVDLNLPKPPNGLPKQFVKDEYDYAEFKVRADKPIILSVNGGDACETVITFVPQKNRNYEMKHYVTHIIANQKHCKTTVEEFGLDSNGQYYSKPIAIKKPKSCAKSQ